MRKILFSMFILTLFLSGCLSSDDLPLEEPTEVVEVHRFSHQFWNEAPMGAGNTTTMNASGMFQFNLRTYFHDEGNLTMTLKMGNETLYSEVFHNSTVYREIPVYRGCELSLLAVGYHNQTMTPIGDFYSLSGSILN